MKLVYTHPNSILVAQARTALELANIECQLRNEYAAGAMGELAPIDTWPELWVASDKDRERAKQLIAESRVAVQEPDWTCGQCGSESPATFELCWRCAGERRP